MERRQFLKSGALAGAAALLSKSASALSPDAAAQPETDQPPFSLKYAPHFGMFHHHSGGDLVKELEFMHAMGFRAIEDNGMRDRPKEEQELIGNTLQRLGMQMGVFVAHTNAWGGPNFTSGNAEQRDKFLADIKESIEIQKRVHATWMTVVPAEIDPRLEPGYQTANVVDTLRRAAALCEPTGLVMVLEALNPWRDHPRMFLWKIAQSFEICRAVNSPSCKILFDMYHQQISEGNIIPNIDLAWSEIAYFQIGDNPGRNEPGTGEMNYKNIFKHIREKGYTGILGMEHGNSQGGKKGEMAVIEAYRDADKG